jgi:hypothetical protein
MCNFFSALILRNGDVKWHPMLDRHSDLVTYFKIPDTMAGHQYFAKAELVPPVDGDISDVSTWKFTLDEETEPGWWSEVAERTVAEMRRIASGMIIKTGEHALICDGVWIVCGDAIVRDVRAGRLVHVGGSARVTDVWGSAQVTDVRDSARVTNVRDSARVTNVWGSAQVTNVRGSARVTNVRDSAQVTNVRGSARVTNVGDSARVTNVRGSARVTRHDGE